MVFLCYEQCDTDSSVLYFWGGFLILVWSFLLAAGAFRKSYKILWHVFTFSQRKW